MAKERSDYEADLSTSPVEQIANGKAEILMTRKRVPRGLRRLVSSAGRPAWISRGDLWPYLFTGTPLLRGP